MPVPLLIPAIIGASTIASLATPFFFPTEQDKADIEIANQLKTGNFTIVKDQPEIKIPSFSDKLSDTVEVFKEQLSGNSNWLFLLVGIFILIMVVR